MTSQRINSAGRLYEIFEGLGQQNNQLTLQQAWGAVLSVPQENTERLYRFLSAVHELVGKVETDIRNIENLDHERYLRYLDSYRNVLSITNLQANVSSIRKQITTVSMDYLGMCKDALEANGIGEGPISETTLTELEQEIDALLERVIAGELLDALKQIVIESLKNIKHAISLYHIYGAQRFKVEIQKAFGAMVLEYDSAVKHKKNPDFQDYLNLIHKIYGITSSAITIAKTLASPIQMLLSSP